MCARLASAGKRHEWSCWVYTVRTLLQTACIFPRANTGCPSIYVLDHGLLCVGVQHTRHYPPSIAGLSQLTKWCSFMAYHPAILFYGVFLLPISHASCQTVSARLNDHLSSCIACSDSMLLSIAKSMSSAYKP